MLEVKCPRNNLALKEQLFSYLIEILKIFKISWKVVNLKRCIIKRNWEIESIDFDKWLHKNLPDWIASWFILELHNGKKVLYVRGSWYNLERYGIDLEDKFLKVITDEDINNLVDYEKQNFLEVFDKIQNLERKIASAIKDNLIFSL